MKRLDKILSGIQYSSEISVSDFSINSITTDNRKIQNNDLFIAIRGVEQDGHNFIQNAIERGAKAVVCEYVPAGCQSDFAYILVQNSRDITGQLASNFYDNPSEKIKLIGVTGTNGKTTVTTLLKNLFSDLGYKSALISTVQNEIGHDIIPSTHTTPDPVSLNELLARIVEAGCSHCFMEVSSHAADQNRIGGITFAGAVFTNLTQDHLDYHKTFDNYIRAKKKFFDGLNRDAFALVNKDDRNGMVMVQNTRASKYTYSLKSVSDFKGKIIESDMTGMNLEIDQTQAWYSLTGEFNAYNLLAVYGTAFLLGIEKEQIILSLSRVRGAKGRMEVIRGQHGITGIVDYAHTPDALQNILETINRVRSRNENLITIVGCGGDRDRGKRPMMGDCATTLSDTVIFTSDNPRSEDPAMIIDEMVKGVKTQNMKKMVKITNREEAIHAAVRMARPGDIILLAGKGHETYQEINGLKNPFDDYKILSQALNQA